MENLLKKAQILDANDDLAKFRQNFVFADRHLIYLDGNSLGRLPSQAQALIDRVVADEWGEQLIRSWGGGEQRGTHGGWFEAPSRLGDLLGRIIGASPGQVVACDSTSVNLFKLVLAALELRPGRLKIVSDRFNFPSDLYILQGCIRLLNQGHYLCLSGQDFAQERIPALSEKVPPDESELLPALLESIDETTALVTLSHVTFKSGFLYDMRAITEKAHAFGALVIWDLSHSAGVVPIELDNWDVDLAVGCTYKYLNGGPGAPAYLYVNHKHQAVARSPVWGWFGQQAPFAFDLDYAPFPGIKRFLAGTPPVISLLALEPGLELTLEAGVARLRQKSIWLTSYLVELHEAFLAPLGFYLASPRDPVQRGSHISLRHPEGYRINRALIGEMNLVPDFREPDHLRLGLAPIYTSFNEVWEGVERIHRVVAEKRYQRYTSKRSTVT
jgi:kynureninase